MRDKQRELAAKRAADYIKKHSFSFFQGSAEPPIGIVLGTGWGEVLEIKKTAEIPFDKIPGFSRLSLLEGHARRFAVGTISGRRAVALRGRVHMNEAPNDAELAKMARLQIEMLLQLGVKTFIVTSAVGSLGGALKVGEIAVVNGFVTLFAPDMPLWAGEFCSPEDALSVRLREIAREERGEIIVKEVGHVMVRGPFFEGRKYDKGLLAATGAGVVGMSMLPETCVAALYGAEVLGLGFVTNDDISLHSHEENLARAKAASARLGDFLARIVKRI